MSLIEREGHTPPFPLEVWNQFHSINGGRGQSIGEYVPAYHRAFAEAIQYFQDIGVLTTTDEGAYVVLKANNTFLNPRTPDCETLYFVNKEEAEQYSRTWHPYQVRVRKLTSE